MLDPNQLLGGLLIKDINKLEKVSENCSFAYPEITFKVINQFKEGHGEGNEGRLSYQESFSKYGSYTHILEIEPLELGIEGMDSITKIIFQFAEPTQRVSFKPLTKSKLYKSNILTESVGKTFTMRVKKKTGNDNQPTNSMLRNSQNKDFL
ncbi:6932_t:CDS:2, partial [Ambispora gerdemannii]